MNHDTFCHETAYGPAACMNCQTYAKVRADERERIAERIAERYVDQPLTFKELETFIICETIARGSNELM